MAFIGNNSLLALLSNVDVISDFDRRCIKNGAYEMSLGAQVFLTDSSPKCVRNLERDEKIEIKPGQFALLLTKEYVRIPKDKIAFISIKASVKFKGLVNVSGFHVDPGFEGNLLFSVYNAGPSSIILSSGRAYFPIWFAELNENQDYTGNHEKQTKIPDGPVESLSQGELASPNVLNKRIEETKHLQTKIEWVVLAILTLLVGVSVKLWLDNSRLNNAIDFGYNKKNEEIRLDSMRNSMQKELTIFNSKVDSLTALLEKKSVIK